MQTGASTFRDTPYRALSAGAIKCRSLISIRVPLCGDAARIDGIVSNMNRTDAVNGKRMTMKALAIYWIIGCALTGLVIKSSLEWCPDDKIQTADVVGMVAAWPVSIVAVVAGARNTKRVCADGTAYRTQ